MKKTLSIRMIVIYYAIFWLLWTVVELTVMQQINFNFTGWTREFLADSVKMIIWLGYAIFLMKKYSWAMYIKPKELWKFNWRYKGTYWTLLAVVAYLIYATLIHRHTLSILPTFQPENFFEYFLVVGITEESVFRGAFFNLLRPHFNFQTTNIIQALMFVTLHFAIWTTQALTPLTLFSNFITVFVLGYLFGWLVEQSRSIWPSIIVHSVWDLLVTAWAK